MDYLHFRIKILYNVIKLVIEITWMEIYAKKIVNTGNVTKQIEGKKKII